MRAAVDRIASESWERPAGTTASPHGLVAGLESWHEAGIGGVIVLMEEPELFLPPQAQRYLYRLLRLVASQGNQVLYSTHSPAFLNVVRLDELVFTERRPKVGTLLLQPEPLPADEEFRAFSEFDSSRSELFLARAAVLVEGLTEKLTLPFIFESLGYDPDRERISIIECGGKGNIPLFGKISKAVELPFVAVHDRDAPEGDEPSDAERQLNALIAEVAGPERVELAPDFEGVAGIHGDRQKPARAWRRFADLGAEDVPKPLAEVVERAIALARREPSLTVLGLTRERASRSAARRLGRLRRPVGALALRLRLVRQALGLGFRLPRGGHRHGRLLLEVLGSLVRLVGRALGVGRSLLRRPRLAGPLPPNLGGVLVGRLVVAVDPAAALEDLEPFDRAESRRRASLSIEDTGLEASPELVVDRRGIERRGDRITVGRASRADRRDARLRQRLDQGPALVGRATEIVAATPGERLALGSPEGLPGLAERLDLLGPRTCRRVDRPRDDARLPELLDRGRLVRLAGLLQLGRQAIARRRELLRRERVELAGRLRHAGGQNPSPYSSSVTGSPQSGAPPPFTATCTSGVCGVPPWKCHSSPFTWMTSPGLEDVARIPFRTHAPASAEREQELTSGMPVPMGPGVRGEVDLGDAAPVVGRDRRAKPDLTGEPLLVALFEDALGPLSDVHGPSVSSRQL